MRSLRLAVIASLVLTANAIADERSEVAAAIDRARYLRGTGKHRESVLAAEAAMTKARENGDPALLFRAAAELGDSRFYALDYAGAIPAFTEALAIAQQTGDRRGESGQHKNLGITWAAQGRLDLALAHLHLSMETAQRYLPNGVSRSTHANVGTVYQRLGARQLAIRAFRQALAPGPEPLTPRAELDARTRIGSLYLDAGEPAAALPELRAALAAAAQGAPPVEEAWILGYLVPAQIAVGDLDGALASVRREIELDRSLGYAGPLRLGLVRLGDLQRNDPAAARAAYTEAGAIASGESWLWLPKARLARLAAEEGDRQRALAGYDVAGAVFERFVNRLDYEVALGEVAGNRSMYEEWMKVVLPRGHDPSAEDVETAVRIVERARGATLGWKPEQSGEGEDALLPRRRSEAVKRLAELRTIQPAPDDPRSDEMERLELELWRLRHEAGGEAQAVPERLLSRVAAELEMSEALLAYFSLDTELLLFVVTHDGAKLHRLPVVRSELTLRVESLLARLSASSGEGWRGMARRLHRDLVANALNALPREVQTLTIVADGSLNGLPFEALLGDGDEPLVRRYAVSYADSISELLSERIASRQADASSASGRLLVLHPGPAAVSRSDRHGLRALFREEGFTAAPLQHADVEVNAIRAALGPRVEIWRGEEAQESRLTPASLTSFSALHFTTHGMVSRWSPWRSALLLAPGKDDGLLQAREIAARMPPCHLVVLAACRTAVGQPRAGREVRSLAEAFRHAGARTVVASAWDVEDASTARLFAAFYRELATGTRPADALRRAKLSLLDDDATSAPAHWAGFMLYGNGRTPVAFSRAARASRGAGRKWIALLFAAIAVAVIVSRAHSTR